MPTLNCVPSSIRRMHMHVYPTNHFMQPRHLKIKRESMLTFLYHAYAADEYVKKKKRKKEEEEEK